MRKKPEEQVELFFFRCRIKPCEKPYGLCFTRKSEAEMQWFHHAGMFHQGKIEEIPPYTIKSKQYKVEEE